MCLPLDQPRRPHDALHALGLAVSARGQCLPGASVRPYIFLIARCLPGMQVACVLWLAESGLGLNCWFVSSLPPVLTLN